MGNRISIIYNTQYYKNKCRVKSSQSCLFFILSRISVVYMLYHQKFARKYKIAGREGFFFWVSTKNVVYNQDRRRNGRKPVLKLFHKRKVYMMVMVNRVVIIIAWEEEINGFVGCI